MDDEIKSTTTQGEAVDPASALFGVLEWHKGPANGGKGTADTAADGTHRWWSDDRLIIVIETNMGREMAIVDIDCDEHYFSVKDASSGDEYDAWGPESWAWWAKLTDRNLPPNAHLERPPVETPPASNP